MGDHNSGHDYPTPGRDHEDEQSAPQRGRPRRLAVDEAVRAATTELLGEMSFSELSVAMVAQRAGVGKSTVYRRWPSKDALVVDVVAHRLHPPEIEQADLDFKEYLWQSTVGMAVDAGKFEWAHVIPCLVGEAMTKTKLGEILREQYLIPRRQQAEAVIARGVAQGLLREDLDPLLMVLLLLGPVVNAWIIEGTPIEPEQAARLFEEVWTIISKGT
jgi:AcrR family transcriptional regulator